MITKTLATHCVSAFSGTSIPSNQVSRTPERLPCIPRHDFQRSNLISHRRPRRTLTCVAAQKVKFTSFEDMISRSELILVDFYATWCGPCQMMAGVLSQASGTLAGNATIAKVDTEKYPALASKFNVSGLPTLILFKNGKPLGRLEGAVGLADLQRWVQQQVSRAS